MTGSPASPVIVDIAAIGSGSTLAPVVDDVSNVAESSVDVDVDSSTVVVFVKSGSTLVSGVIKPIDCDEDGTDVVVNCIIGGVGAFVGIGVGAIVGDGVGPGGAGDVGAVAKYGVGAMVTGGVGDGVAGVGDRVDGSVAIGNGVGGFD